MQLCFPVKMCFFFFKKKEEIEHFLKKHPPFLCHHSFEDHKKSILNTMLKPLLSVLQFWILVTYFFFSAQLRSCAVCHQSIFYMRWSKSIFFLIKVAHYEVFLPLEKRRNSSSLLLLLPSSWAFVLQNGLFSLPEVEASLLLMTALQRGVRLLSWVPTGMKALKSAWKCQVPLKQQCNSSSRSRWRNALASH